MNVTFSILPGVRIRMRLGSGVRPGVGAGVRPGVGVRVGPGVGVRVGVGVGRQVRVLRYLGTLHVLLEGRRGLVLGHVLVFVLFIFGLCFYFWSGNNRTVLSCKSFYLVLENIIKNNICLCNFFLYFIDM